jgi:hypothetical protein
VKSEVTEATMEKIDYKQKLKHLYQPSAKEVVEVNVPPMNFLMIDGQGDPNTSKAFAEAVEALFAVSYTLKFMIKKGSSAIDYGVMPLEGQWWADDMSKFSTANKANWKWTAMIMQPPPVTKELIRKALVDIGTKKKLNALPNLRFERLAEGTCAQILHIGPFSEEGPTIERVHQFIHSRESKLTGKHHEIYLSDIRKADSKRWKTIIRQPMQ